MAESDFLIPHWPDAPANVGVLVSTRHGGVSLGPYDDGQGGPGLNLGQHVGDLPAHVERNRHLLSMHLPGAPRWLSQVHGVAVHEVQADAIDSAAPEADASFTGTRALVCAIMTADCLPVLLADRAGTVVGAAHAGWRGLAAGVLGATVAAMRAAGANEIVACLGPAIGAGSFEVGGDVLDTFVAAARSEEEARHLRAAFVALPARPGKYLADLNALARSMLARDGVLKVSGGDHCTVSEPSRFYSYRRDGVTGRQATLIWLK